MDFYSLLGVVVWYSLILWLTVKILKGLWTSWIADALGQNYKWRVTPDSWAVITGATDGIGLEYARELGKKGLNLLLISRNPTKLNETKESIHSSAPKCKEIRTLAIDFSKPEGIYEKIRQEVAKLPTVEALVNNVGISYCTPELYSQLEVTNSQSFVDDVININVISCAKMIKIVLPRMESQKKGVIINISSISAAYPTPLLSLYAASKIFVDLLSRSLHGEVKDKRIIVQSVLPSYVMTKMSKIRKPSFLVPTPKAYVQGAMKTIGVESRTYGYWTHKLQGFVQDHIIFGIFGADTMAKIAHNSLISIRKSYYRKYIDNKKE